MFIHTLVEPQVDMAKVNMDVMRPWISERVYELLGFEDDVVPEFICGLLESPVGHASYSCVDG